MLHTLIHQSTFHTPIPTIPSNHPPHLFTENCLSIHRPLSSTPIHPHLSTPSTQPIHPFQPYIHSPQPSTIHPIHLPHLSAPSTYHHHQSHSSTHPIVLHCLLPIYVFVCLYVWSSLSL